MQCMKQQCSAARYAGEKAAGVHRYYTQMHCMKSVSVQLEIARWKSSWCAVNHPRPCISDSGSDTGLIDRRGSNPLQVETHLRVSGAWECKPLESARYFQEETHLRLRGTWEALESERYLIVQTSWGCEVFESANILRVQGTFKRNPTWECEELERYLRVRVLESTHCKWKVQDITHFKLCPQTQLCIDNHLKRELMTCHYK